MKQTAGLLLIALAAVGCSEAKSASTAVASASNAIPVSNVAPAAAAPTQDVGDVATATPILTVSSPAASKLRAARDSMQSKYIRVHCKRGGCTGFLYDLKFADDYDTASDILLKSDGVDLVLDHDSAELLRGTTLDFLTENGQTGFKFQNPNKPDLADETDPEPES